MAENRNSPGVTDRDRQRRNGSQDGGSNRTVDLADYTPRNNLARLERNRFAADSTFSFPSDADSKSQNSITFSNYEYRRPTIGAPTQGTRVGLIQLPIPRELEVGYSADWNVEALGTAGNIVANRAGDGNINSLKESLKNISGASAANVMEEYIKGKLTDVVFKSNGGNNDISDAFQGVQVGFGVAKNPFQAMLYKGPEFRKHEFQWKFMPRNSKESETLKNIIRTFKAAQHPSYDVLILENKLFSYPNLWFMEFKDDTYLYKFAQSVLTNVGVNYHSEDAPAYHDDNAPLAVTLKLSFTEAVILQRTDIEGGY